MNNLARQDEFDVIKKVQEVCLDYLSLTPELMITGLPSALSLGKSKELWGELELKAIERIQVSIASSILSLRKKVHVRYLTKSDCCLRIADGVNVDYNERRCC